MKPSQVIGSMQIGHSPFCMELRTRKIPCRSPIPRFAWNSGRKKFHADRPYPRFAWNSGRKKFHAVRPYPDLHGTPLYLFNNHPITSPPPLVSPLLSMTAGTQAGALIVAGSAQHPRIRATSSNRATTSIRTTTSFPRVRSAPSHHAHVAPVPRYNCPASAANPSFLPMYPGC